MAFGRLAVAQLDKSKKLVGPDSLFGLNKAFMPNFSLQEVAQTYLSGWVGVYSVIIVLVLTGTELSLATTTMLT